MSQYYVHNILKLMYETFQVTMLKSSVPSYSFGIRHSQYEGIIYEQEQVSDYRINTSK